MRSGASLVSRIALAAGLALAGCGKHDNATNSGGDVATPASATPTATSTSPTMDSAAYSPTATEPAKHHSKLAGAAVGAVAGHMLGGHAVAGAAAGALIQHERNKHH